MDSCQNRHVGAIVLLLHLSRWLLKGLQNNIFLIHGWGHEPSGFHLISGFIFFHRSPTWEIRSTLFQIYCFALRFMSFHKSSFPFIRLNVLYIVCTLEEYLTATMCSEAKILAYTSRSWELHPDPEARAPLQDTMPPVCEKQPANKKNRPNADRLLEFLFNSFIFTETQP